MSSKMESRMLIPYTFRTMSHPLRPGPIRGVTTCAA
jgi:hypothetical protein